jgi:ferric-dicitrate binding protein FerR (iron transport regulator)
VRSDGGDKGQTWAVLYDDGMSLTTASERVARSLAEAEHRRGHRVTVRLLDDAETRPRDAEKPISEPGPAPAPEPARVSGPPQAVEPAQAAEPAPVPEPARAPAPAGRRRLLVYALAAVCIVVAAALAAHWGVLPRVGADTGSSPTQVSGSPHRPQLIPPLNQPPVMHFSSAVKATSPRSATAESSGGGPSAIARGG